MKYTQGFTLIELVMVMVLMSILIAVAIPKYNNLTSAGETAAKAASAGAVRSAFSGYIASHAGVAPTNAQLASELSGTGCVTATTGITCTLKNGTSWLIPTYTDANCSVATTASSLIVCIGG